MRFRITIEHFIIVILAVLLCLESCEREPDCIPDKVETLTEEKTVTKTTSGTNPEIKDQEPEVIDVIETPEKVERVKNAGDLPPEDREKVKQVNRYLDTIQLEGATIFSEILAEGRILENNIKAEIQHKETTITTTETAIERPGGLFFSPGVNYSALGGVKAVEGSITYIKGNWGASAGAYYNFRSILGEDVPGSLGVTLKFHIKL